MFSRLFRTLLGWKLTDFEPRLLSRAGLVHLAHKRAHLHRVLVLMVQAVGLEEAEGSDERTEADLEAGKGLARAHSESNDTRTRTDENQLGAAATRPRRPDFAAI